jgi:hypothetical protein
MGDKTGIEWTEATWNPTTGCDKVSPGCAHCYAEGVADRLWATQYPAVMPDGTSVNAVPVHIAEEYQREGLTRPRAFTDVQCHEDRLDQPLRWKKPRKVFVNSMSDLFHEDVPDAFIDRVFAVMALAPQHTFQILTKRAERMRAYLGDPEHAARPCRYREFALLPGFDRIVWSGMAAAERVARRLRGEPALCRRADPAAAADAGGGAVHLRRAAARSGGLDEYPHQPPQFD